MTLNNEFHLRIVSYHIATLRGGGGCGNFTISENGINFMKLHIEVSQKFTKFHKISLSLNIKSIFFLSLGFHSEISE